MSTIVANTYLLPDGNIVTFDQDNKEMPELQGKDSEELRKKIIKSSDEMTKVHGYYIKTPKSVHGDVMIFNPDKIKMKAGWYMYIEQMEHHHLGQGKSIYKLECKLTGHYYYGQTKDLTERMYTHLQSIMSLMRGMNPNRPLQFHLKLAPIVKDFYDNSRKIKMWPYIKQNFKVSVLAFIGEHEIADIVERWYIDEAKADPLCLNGKECFTKRYN